MLSELLKVSSVSASLILFNLWSSVSVSLHRPNMLRFSNYMAECVDVLESSPNASLNDHRLVAWIQLQRIMEECSTSFAFDDPSASVSLKEPRIQLMLKGFEKKLKGWRENLMPGIMNSEAANRLTNGTKTDKPNSNPAHEFSRQQYIPA